MSCDSHLRRDDGLVWPASALREGVAMKAHVDDFYYVAVLGGWLIFVGWLTLT